MPSGLIQPRLPGFLDLLQLKNQGRQPPALADEVQLGIDVSQWYAQDRMVSEISAPYVLLSNAFANLRVVRFTVPQGQWWMIGAANVQLNYTSATCTDIRWSTFAPYIQYPGASAANTIQLGPEQPFDSTPFTTFPASNASMNGSSVVFNTPLLVPPGTNIGIAWCGEVIDPVNANSAYCMLRYAPLLL